MFPFSFFRRPHRRPAPTRSRRPCLESLEDRLTPATVAPPTLTIVGVDQGISHVKVFSGTTEVASFFAFDPTFQGGARVGIADVNGDGALDYIVGAGPGGGPHVKVIDGTRANQVLSNGQIADSALLASFFAFDPSITSGVFVTAGDFNHDSKAGVAVSAATGTESQVRAFGIANGRATHASGPLGDFVPYAGFGGAITLAAGDLNGDGRDELITGTFRGSSHLKPFDAATGATILSEFLYPGFNGGFSVSTADVTGDGRAEIITGGAEGAGGHMKILDGVTGQPISSFFGLGAGFNGGTRVAALGVSEGGVATLHVIGAPNPDRAATINESTPDGVLTGQFQPFGNFSGGLFVASSH
jgi:hypothetical protein